ncbi:MAG: hypothetical protein KQH63_21820 [Desulfobulbaceae bacterium]|nr:hypothetical protein [Desulfobulbaceae bacterium]
MTTNKVHFKRRSTTAFLLSFLILAAQFVAIFHTSEHPFHNQDSTCQMCITAAHAGTVTYDAPPQALQFVLHCTGEIFLLPTHYPATTPYYSLRLSRAPPVSA